MKSKMFKLLKLEITNHAYFGDISLNFVNEEEEHFGPYTTLVIGPNGTGKSQILASIIEILNYLSAFKVRDKLYHKFEYSYDILYQFDEDKIRVYNTEGKTKAQKNKEPIEVKDVPIPSKILASAINLTDRYPNLTRSSKFYNSNYQYLGVRSASNNAFINNHVKSIVDSLSEAISKQLKLHNLKFLFEELGLAPILTIQYKAGDRFQQYLFEDENLFTKTIKDKIVEHFNRHISKQKDKPKKDYRTEKYEKTLKDDNRLLSASEFLKINAENFKGKFKNKISYTSNLDFSSSESINHFIQDVIALKTLVDLEILVYDKIGLQKTQNRFSFIQASSGEYHLLTSFIGIFSKIEDNSIILIDEPEISLHPNWQMKYMHNLNRIFETFKSCHFIIASHSHFLVSDLKEKQSSILKLFFNTQKNKIDARRLDWNTYAWSAEQVLIEVFKVPSSRNIYLTELINETLHLMAKERLTPLQEQQVNENKNQLAEFELDLKEADPLKTIIQKILE